MRERIVQVAGNLQALAHDRGIARLFRESFHFARAHRDAPLELAALLLKIAKNLGERGSKLRNFIDAAGNFDARSIAFADAGHRLRQALQAPGQMPRTQYPEQLPWPLRGTSTPTEFAGPMHWRAETPAHSAHIAALAIPAPLFHYRR